MKKHNFLFNSLKISFLSLLVFNLSSCDKCKNTECFTPPEQFRFQLIDKKTNQDLLKNGTYTLSTIRIKSVSENKFHTLQIDSVEIEGQKQAFLVDNEIGWENGTDNKNYILSLGDSLKYSFVHYSEKKKGECCDYYQVKEVSSSQLEITEPTPNNGYLYKLSL